MASQTDKKEIVVSVSTKGAPRKMAVPSSKKELDVRAKGKDQLEFRPPTPEILKALIQDEINDLDLSGYDLRQVPLTKKVFNDCKLGALVTEFTDCQCNNCDVSGFKAMQPDGSPGGDLGGSAWRSCFLGDTSNPPDISGSRVDGFGIISSNVPGMNARAVVGENHYVRKSVISYANYEDSLLRWLDVSDGSVCNHTSFARFKTVDISHEEILKLNQEQVAALTGGATFDTVAVDSIDFTDAIMPNSGLHITRGIDINLSNAKLPNSEANRFDWRFPITTEDTSVAYCRFRDGILKYEAGKAPFVECHIEGLDLVLPDKTLTPQRVSKWGNKLIREASRLKLDETSIVAKTLN